MKPAELGTLQKLANARLIQLEGFVPETGHCWICRLPRDLESGDSSEVGERSTLRLFEDGREIGPAHSSHKDIREAGRGRFSHWGTDLYLSASDNANPLPPSRRYVGLIEESRQGYQQQTLAAAANVDPESLSAEQCYNWGERLFSLFVKDAKLAEYGRSFFRDSELLSDYERFDRQNYRSLDRKFALKEFLRLALRLEGDLAECGVFRGASAYLMAKATRAAGVEKTLHLFDSFTGLSSPQPIDGSYWNAGALACSLAEVATALSPYADLLAFHPGWIPSAFLEVAERKFSFVHIDVDLFQPTWDSLCFFYPRLTPGGLIICDDYGFDTCPGARRAVDDFFGSRSESPIHLPTGQAVIFVDGFGRDG